jgi:hypothetical protein
MGIIRNIGGVAGYVAGDMRNCSNGGAVSIASASDITEDVGFLVGEIGGLAGAQGDVNDPTKAPVTEGCRNAGALIFSITGAGGRDRFGQQLYSVSFAVGGIIGQASGVVRNCTNSGIVNTSNGSDAKPESGRGASNTGGIVGSLRGKSFEATNAESMTNASANDPAYDHFVKKGGAAASPASYPTSAAVYDCANTGVVIGLAAVGGVVGTAGTFTEIEGCSNTADVKGCRWNKPFAGGVAGTTQGDVRYCYTRGDVHSVTGGGYYCTGLVSGLWSANNSLTKDNERVPVTELTGCYTTGYIFTSSAGYRTGILAGENEGYIHHNAYLPSLSLDDKIVDTDVGTVRDNEKLSPADLKGSKGRALLNTYAAGKGSWDVCYLPDKGNRNDGYPVLKRIGSDADLSVTTPTAISSDWTAKLTADAPYSASINPVPQFSVSSGGKTLLQNADFRVVPAPDAKGQDAGGAEYTATIAGIGGYKGKFSDATKTKYRITKAAIESCTIVSDAVIFNWEVQRPTKEHTRLIDEAGNEVTKAAYTVSDLYNGGDTTGKIENGVIRYYDYINAHGPNYKYDVVVTASSSAVNYTGKAVQQAFRIDWASMLPQNDPDHDKTLPERVTYGDVVWQGETWDFLKALEDTSGDTIRIPYTGDPITPTFVSATYKGLPLRLATDLDYIYHPLKYDFKYIYGNPNPELAGGASSEPVDVTPGEPTCMTARFTNGGNFDGFINIFYRIVPADIGLVTIVFPDRPYTGGAHTPTPQITYNGKELREGKDYTVSRLAYASNVSAGAATADIAIDGLGNFSGSLNRSVNFNITPLAISPAAVAIADRTYTGKAQKPKPTVTCGGVALKEGADYTLSKITYKANKAVGDATAKFTVTGAGNYAGSVEKTLTFRIRPGTAKAVKVSVGKRSMKVSFRKAPASHKVTAYEVRYRMKGTKKWRVRSCPASKSSVTVKGLKKGKRYEAQVRSVKKVKVKTGKSKKAKTTAYYGAWSAIKTSKKIR